MNVKGRNSVNYIPKYEYQGRIKRSFLIFIKKSERSDSTLRHSSFEIRYSAVRFFIFV